MQENRALADAKFNKLRCSAQPFALALHPSPSPQPFPLALRPSPSPQPFALALRPSVA